MRRAERIKKEQKARQLFHDCLAKDYLLVPRDLVYDGIENGFFSSRAKLYLYFLSEMALKHYLMDVNWDAYIRVSYKELLEIFPQYGFPIITQAMKRMQKRGVIEMESEKNDYCGLLPHNRARRVYVLDAHGKRIKAVTGVEP